MKKRKEEEIKMRKILDDQINQKKNMKLLEQEEKKQYGEYAKKVD